MRDQKLASLLQVVIFFLLIPVYHLWGLMRYPAPFVDEAWQGARSWGLIATGQAFGPLDSGVIDQLEGYWTFFPKIPTILFSFGLRWVSEPNLLATRLVSLGAGLLLLAGVYSIAKSIQGSTSAKLSLLLVSFSIPFQYSSHLGRKDIFTATFGVWAIALYLNDNSNSNWKAFFSGLLIGLAFETHANAAIYFPILFWLFYYDHGFALFRLKHFWSMLIGLLVGMLYYLTIHVFPYPNGFLEFNELVYIATHTPPLFTHDFLVILFSFVSAFEQLVDSLSLTLVFVPLIVWEAVKGINKDHRRFTFMVLLLLLSYALLVRNKIPYYAVLVTPFVDISIAVYVVKLYREFDRGIFMVLARGFVFISFSLLLITNLGNVLSNRYDNYQEVTSRLMEIILPDDAIMGSQTYWLDFHENIYYSWENIVYFQRKNNTNSIAEALFAFRPNIIIVDSHWKEFIFESPPASGYFQNLHLLSTEFNTALRDVGAELVTTIDDEYYGPVEVYRIFW